MMYFTTTAELARHLNDERLAAAERRHRVFRRPITDYRSSHAMSCSQ